MLYCIKCKKIANKRHKCDTSSLITVTKNMIPVANIIDCLGLSVSSTFCLADTHKNHTLIEAGVYFKHIYSEVLLQDLPSGWYWTDYITTNNKVICSCIAYEADCIDGNDKSLREFVEGAINDLIRYLETRDPEAMRSIITLMYS